VLLVVENKSLRSTRHPLAQLIVEAIAAFILNNKLRCRLLMPTLEADIINGITIKGTLPTFFRINVSAALVASVQSGEYPQQPVVIYAH